MVIRDGTVCRAPSVFHLASSHLRGRKEDNKNEDVEMTEDALRQARQIGESVRKKTAINFSFYAL